MTETFTTLREEVNRPPREDGTTLNKLSNEMIPWLGAIQKSFGEYMDIAVEKTAGKIHHRNPVFQEMYFLNWDEMDDYLPKVLSWFSTIFRKILRLDNEGSIIAPNAMISLQLSLMIMFYGTLMVSVIF